MTSVEKELLFAYGTLQVPEVMTRVTGERFDGVAAVLPGYRCLQVRDADYPGIAPETRAKTHGTVLMGLTDRDLEHLDRFEGELYQRQTVQAVTDDGRTLSTWAYVIREAYRNRLGEKPWSLEQFLVSGYERFMAEFVGRPWNQP